MWLAAWPQPLGKPMTGALRLEYLGLGIRAPKHELLDCAAFDQKGHRPLDRCLIERPNGADLIP